MSVLLKMGKRIAIYGGTFDPVHSGHLEIAKRVTELFAIDEFLFMPARRAPHKTDRIVSSPLDRYAMLALAVQGEPKLGVSKLELNGPERQYTVDTLSEIRLSYGAEADLFFTLGADSWLEITAWREWQRLITLANLIVVTRPGFETQHREHATEFGEVVDVRGLTATEISRLVQPGRQKVFITNAVMIDVSATEVRRAARDNKAEDLNKLVPLAVADYIRKYRLYRNTNEA